MSAQTIVAIGASAGGVEALRSLVSALPADFAAAVFVVLHIRRHGPSLLPALLERAGALPARHAVHAEPIRPSRIYVAPPDQHMLVRPGLVSLDRGPAENGSRPAADPLFRSAAQAYGVRAIGVVLSGSLDDGTAGLLAIKRAGGLTLAQDPAEAAYASMPQSAIDNVDIDAVRCVAELGSLLCQWVRQLAQGSPGAADASAEGESGQRVRDDEDP